MADDNVIVGDIEEVFTNDEDVVNDLEETNVIEEPEDNPEIPEEDKDFGEGGDTSEETIVDDDIIEPDEEDIINTVEENDLTEYPIAVDEEEVKPIITNVETLPTIGNIENGDKVMIALVNGEPTILGSVGSGDRQQTEINNLSNNLLNVSQYFWHNTQDSGAGEGAGAHITEIPMEDFIADPSNGGGNLLAQSGGIAIRDGLTKLATFGASGEAFWNEGGGKMFQVGRKKDGNFRIGESCFYDGSSPFSFKWHWNSTASASTPSFTYNFYKADGTKVNLSSILDEGAVSANGAVITLSEAVCSEMITQEVKTIKWSYIADYDLPYFSLGIRDDTKTIPSHIPIGCFSVVAGTNNKADGDCSYAGGQGTRSAGGCSHAEGTDTLAQQKNSFAIGFHTHANDNEQFVTGRYNEVDTNCAFIIGNGTESGNSNALKIDWDGNVEASGIIKADGNSEAIGAQTNPVKDSNTIALAAGTWKTLYKDSDTSKTAVSISKGCYVGFVDVQFTAATGSYRSIYFGTSSTGTTIGTQVGGSSTSAIINVRHPFTLSVSSTTNYYVRVRSGVKCDVANWSVRLMRIR